MIGDNMERFQITLGKPIVKRLDEYREILGMTRSAAIASLVARQLVADDALINALQTGVIDPQEVVDMDELKRLEMVGDGLIETAY